MLAGEPFNPADPELAADHRRVRERLRILNTEGFPTMVDNADLLAEILPNCPRGTLIQPPFFCDYGYNIHCGEGVYFNYNCTVLDVGRVEIGSHVFFGPGVQIYAVTHPIDAHERRKGQEWGVPVVIGDDCWIGGGTVIRPGVRIGDRCVIGAGSVVTRDIPDDSMAAGVPARVRRKLR